MYGKEFKNDILVTMDYISIKASLREINKYMESLESLTDPTTIRYEVIDCGREGATGLWTVSKSAFIDVVLRKALYPSLSIDDSEKEFLQQVRRILCTARIYCWTVAGSLISERWGDGDTTFDLGYVDLAMYDGEIRRKIQTWTDINDGTASESIPSSSLTDPVPTWTGEYMGVICHKNSFFFQNVILPTFQLLPSSQRIQCELKTGKPIDVDNKDTGLESLTRVRVSEFYPMWESKHAAILFTGLECERDLRCVAFKKECFASIVSHIEQHVIHDGKNVATIVNLKDIIDTMYNFRHGKPFVKVNLLNLTPELINCEQTAYWHIVERDMSFDDIFWDGEGEPIIAIKHSILSSIDAILSLKTPESEDDTECKPDDDTSEIEWDGRYIGINVWSNEKPFLHIMDWLFYKFNYLELDGIRPPFANPNSDVYIDGNDAAIISTPDDTNEDDGTIRYRKIYAIPVSNLKNLTHEILYTVVNCADEHDLLKRFVELNSMDDVIEEDVVSAYFDKNDLYKFIESLKKGERFVRVIGNVENNELVLSALSNNDDVKIFNLFDLGLEDTPDIVCQMDAILFRLGKNLSLPDNDHEHESDECECKDFESIRNELNVIIDNAAKEIDKCIRESNTVYSQITATAALIMTSNITLSAINEQYKAILESLQVQEIKKPNDRTEYDNQPELNIDTLPTSLSKLAATSYDKNTIYHLVLDRQVAVPSVDWDSLKKTKETINELSEKTKLLTKQLKFIQNNFTIVVEQFKEKYKLEEKKDHGATT